VTVEVYRPGRGAQDDDGISGMLGEDFDALVQFDSYYCEDEEAGCITFRYRLIPKVPKDVS